MEERTTSLRHRIPTEKRRLNAYTVREYKRKYAAGDNSWAYRGGMTV